MRLIENKLYLTFNEAVECGIKAKTMIDAKSTGSKCWDFIDDPADKRKVLVGYEALTPERQEKVFSRFGNPYELVAKTPILNMVVPDFKAGEFYKQYRYGNNLYLPIARVNQYTRAASWLNLVNRVITDKQLPKKELGLTVTEFYLHTGDLLTLEKQRGKLPEYTGIDVLPGDFPTSYQRLADKAREFKRDGYDCLISHMLGNKSSAKLGKVIQLPAGTTPDIALIAGNNMEVLAQNVAITCLNTANNKGAFAQERYEAQMAVIRDCSVKHNNFDAVTIQQYANFIFERNGWEQVSVATIRKFLSENKHLLTPGRKGKRAYENKFAMQVKRKAPEYPLYYWTEDSWTVELSYRIPGPKGGNKFGRLVVCVVLDPFNKYPVGYAVGDIENTDLIRAANRNAIIHMQELLGDYYRPWQLQSDNFQIKNLTEFYQAVTKLHTPAQVGNAKAKVIEPYFMYLNKTYCQKMANWTGFNLDANRDNQVNSEMTDQIKNTFPDKAGVCAQIDSIFKYERKIKREAFLQAWEACPATDKVVLGKKDWIQVFGELLGDRTVKVTGQGLMKTINGNSYVWDSFEPEFRANAHIDWQIFADRYDMTAALAVSPDGKKKFLLHEKRVLPMDAKSMTQADWDYLSATNEFNKANRAAITAMYGDDATQVERIMKETPLQLDAPDELALKVMWTVNGQQKNGIQAAKGLVEKQPATIPAVAKCYSEAVAPAPVDNWEEMQAAFRKDRVDVGIYANME